MFDGLDFAFTFYHFGSQVGAVKSLHFSCESLCHDTLIQKNNYNVQFKSLLPLDKSYRSFLLYLQAVITELFTNK